MTKQNGRYFLSRTYALSSHWLFFIFFHLTILKLLPGSMGNRLAGGVVFIIVFALFCRQVAAYWEEIQKYMHEHRLECTVCLLAVLFLIASCLVNFDWQQEHQWPLSAILMLSALASYAFLILSYWLFRLNQADSGYEIVLFLFVLAHAIAIWEYFHFPSVQPILQSTLRSGHLTSYKVSSFFDNSTVYGPLAAVSGIFFLKRFMARVSGFGRRGLELICALGGFAGALLAGSRSGLLAMGVGLIVIFCQVNAKKKAWILIISILAVAAVHWIAFYHPNVARRTGKILPYMEKFYTDEKIVAQDFIPRLDSRAMSGRPRIWSRAIELYKESPLLGIGLGQFNVRSGSRWAVNVHNIYLNILTECGVIVFLVYIYILFKFIWQRRGSPVFAVLISFAVIGFFDNQYDHSLSWNLTIAWMLANGDRVINVSAES